MNIPVIDVRGQYNHLITRILNELGVESKLIPVNITKDKLYEMKVDGIVMGGGPQRIGSEADKFGNLSSLIKEIEIPMLGICVTHQLIAIIFGGKAGPAKFPEYGPVEIIIEKKDDILEAFGRSFTAWETHNDEIRVLPKNFENLAYSKKCRIQVIRHKNLPIFGVQFHPEVVHTEKGRQIFKNFIKICRRE